MWLHDWYELKAQKRTEKAGVENVSEGKDELPFLMQCWLIQFKLLVELQFNSLLTGVIKWDGGVHLKRVLKVVVIRCFMNHR